MLNGFFCIVVLWIIIADIRNRKMWADIEITNNRYAGWKTYFFSNASFHIPKTLMK